MWQKEAWNDKAGMLFIDGSVSSFDAFFFHASNGKINEEIIARKSEQKVLINCSTCGMKSENSAAKNGSEIEAKQL